MVTKPATTEENRRIREAGTEGEWWPRAVGYVVNVYYQENAELIAHAVNQLIPLSEERDRLAARVAALEVASIKALAAMSRANLLDLPDVIETELSAASCAVGHLVDAESGLWNA